MICLAIISGLTCLVCLISKYSGKAKLVKLMDKIEKKLFFNVILRYLITAYLALYTSAIIEVQDLHRQTAFDALYHLIYIVVLSIYPLFLNGILQQNIHLLHSSLYYVRFLSLYLGIRIEPVALTYTSVFLLDRLCLAWMLLLGNASWLTQTCLCVSQLTFLSYLLLVKPC